VTKAIARVWAKHEWPRRGKLLKEIEKVSRRIGFDSSVQYKIPKDGNFQERAPLGCWAVPKESSKKPKMIKVVPSRLAFDIGGLRKLVPLTLPSTLLSYIKEVRQELQTYFTHIAKLKSSIKAIFSKGKKKSHAGQAKDKRLRHRTEWLITEVEELNEYESDIEGYF
jgi:hypothetical protein